jgi:hypothetical protein
MKKAPVAPFSFYINDEQGDERDDDVQHGGDDARGDVRGDAWDDAPAVCGAVPP